MNESFGGSYIFILLAKMPRSEMAGQFAKCLDSMQDTGCLGLVHWDDPEGWYGEGVGRGFRIGSTCTPVADSCWCMAKPIQYCKVISLQLK